MIPRKEVEFFIYIRLKRIKKVGTRCKRAPAGGLGNYKNHTSILTNRGTFWGPQFVSAKSNALIRWSWYTDKGQYNFLAIGTQFRVNGYSIRFWNDRSRSGYLRKKRPWNTSIR
jgi:hypothetical protein